MHDHTFGRMNNCVHVDGQYQKTVCMWKTSLKHVAPHVATDTSGRTRIWIDQSTQSSKMFTLVVMYMTFIVFPSSQLCVCRQWQARLRIEDTRKQHLRTCLQLNCS